MRDRCFILALSITWLIMDVCSIVPEIFEVKPVWICFSIKLFSFRKWNNEFRKHDVNIFKGTDSNVIGLTFAGSSIEPFLWISIVAAFFHSRGILPESHITRMISVRKGRRSGQRLRQMIDILSSGHGEVEAAIRCMIDIIV